MTKEEQKFLEEVAKDPTCTSCAQLAIHWLKVGIANTESGRKTFQLSLEDIRNCPRKNQKQI